MIVIVGGGHNGLVAATLLARAGREVMVLERRAGFGGAAVSERPFKGRDARLSRYAYLVSLFPPALARELGIPLALADRSVAAYAPYVADDGTPRGLLVEQDATGAATRASFRARTGGDADHDAFLDLNAQLALPDLFGTFLGPLPTRAEARALLGHAAWIADRPLGEVLDERFGDELVSGMVSTDGLIGTLAGVDDADLRQNVCFLYHLVGGPWRVPVGGMGAVSGALEDAARAAGADLRADAEVLAVSDGLEVTWREAGEEHTATADHVLANCAPAVLDRLRGRPVRAGAPGAQLKVNLLLERLPRLRSGDDPAAAFAGTFRLNESSRQLADAYAAARRGEVPEHPPAELYCHTLADPTILGEAGHTLTVFALHVTPDMPGEVVAERLLADLDGHLEEPIRDCLATDADGAPCLEVRTAADLERELCLPHGNIFHGDLDWPWRDDDDPDVWGVATDHPRILRAGASARRGGGVSGVAGHNAAMAVLGL